MLLKTPVLVMVYFQHSALGQHKENLYNISSSSSSSSSPERELSVFLLSPFSVLTLHNSAISAGMDWVVHVGSFTPWYPSSHWSAMAQSAFLINSCGAEVILCLFSIIWNWNCWRNFQLQMNKPDFLNTIRDLYKVCWQFCQGFATATFRIIIVKLHWIWS